MRLSVILVAVAVLAGCNPPNNAQQFQVDKGLLDSCGQRKVLRRNGDRVTFKCADGGTIEVWAGNIAKETYW